MNLCLRLSTKYSERPHRRAVTTTGSEGEEEEEEEERGEAGEGEMCIKEDLDFWGEGEVKFDVKTNYFFLFFVASYPE